MDAKEDDPQNKATYQMNEILWHVRTLFCKKWTCNLFELRYFSICEMNLFYFETMCFLDENLNSQFIDLWDEPLNSQFIHICCALSCCHYFCLTYYIILYTSFCITIATRNGYRHCPVAIQQTCINNRAQPPVYKKIILTKSYHKN
jgi:hypothetical protein